MPAYDPRDIPVDAFYSQSAKDPLPTKFAGAIGVAYNGYPPRNGYLFGTGASTTRKNCRFSNATRPIAAQSYYPSPPPSYPSPPPLYPPPLHYQHQSTQHRQHAAYDPSYSPSHFVQPSLHSQSYGFPTVPQSTLPSYGMPSPLARRNSVVDHPPRPRPPVSDYSSLTGALDGSVGPTRARSNVRRCL